MDSRLHFLLLSPVMGAALSYVAGGVSGRLAGLFATAATIFSFFISLSLASELYLSVDANQSFNAVLGSWITVGEFSFPLALRFDRLASVMCVVITGVGSLIHLYSLGYMAEDKSQHRFFAYLNLFVAAMLLLVLGSSLPVLFIGWEGVGVCSYLLIGFWFTNIDFAKAGRKAFVMNRIGDLGLLVAMFALYHATGTLSLEELGKSDVLARIPNEVAVLSALGLFLAATGKSAQIPLFTWLPDAMAGPTPVSALIHAATMVTAGVYLMARMSGVIELDPFVPALVVWTALATAAVAGTIALVQNDIKKVLAYSTVSQLGFMFIAVGCGAYVAALFHVVTHAFFKAALFLGAGSVIHSCHHEQDMRKMGGLRKFMPVTFLAFGAATLAIAGIWPFAGYHSKHAILDALAVNSNPLLTTFIPAMTLVAKILAALTAFYMARCFIMTFLGEYRGGGEGNHHSTPHEAPLIMTAPVAILGLLSCVAGLLFNNSIFSYLGNFVEINHSASEHAAGLQEFIVGSLPGLIGIGGAVFLFISAPALRESFVSRLKIFNWIFSGLYFVDDIYEFLVLKPIRRVSSILSRGVDSTIVDGTGSALGAITVGSGELVRRATTGQVGAYVAAVLVSASVLLILFMGQ